MLKDASDKLPEELFVDKEDFDNYLVVWAMLFKEEITSTLISESLDLIDERLVGSSSDIDQLLMSLNPQQKSEIDENLLYEFIPQLLNLIKVRVIKLDVTKPKSDEFVCDEKEENMFVDDLVEIARNKKLRALDREQIEQILISYFQGVS